MTSARTTRHKRLEGLAEHLPPKPENVNAPDVPTLVLSGSAFGVGTTGG